MLSLLPNRAKVAQPKERNEAYQYKYMTISMLPQSICQPSIILVPLWLIMNLKEHLRHSIFGTIGRVADADGVRAYVVGGYVRDLLLRRPS